ncbi:MAG: SIMPL domain-containing protein [Candidatus Thiodiazotropha sp. 6PLUC9]
MRHRWLRETAGIIFIGLLSATQSLFAGESTVHYDQVRLSTSAKMEVENDIQIAVMYAQKEGSDLGQLTDQVNQLITQALQKAKQQKSIKVSTHSYQTSPRYQKQQLIGWRVRQSIRLESQESEAMSSLLGSLQGSLALESLSYKISTERREAAEERLTNQAIMAFRKRAEQITQQMQRSHYRLLEMSLQTIDQSPQPYRMRGTMMALESSPSAPAIEAGSQTLSVEISGRIELQLE